MFPSPLYTQTHRSIQRGDPATARSALLRWLIEERNSLDERLRIATDRDELFRIQGASQALTTIIEALETPYRES